MVTGMDDDRLAQIEARLAAATPGPWFAYRDGLAAFIREADLTVIANAPTDLADLVAEVRRLRDRLTVPGVGEVVWETSRADEGTISATGANHVARAVIDYLNGASDV